jgi:hypothetical protein
MRHKSGWRLLLTGTPLQNNLQELVVGRPDCFFALRRLIHVVVPHEFYLTRLVGGLPRVAEGRIQSQGRFQGHFARTGTGFPCQEDDDPFRFAPKERPGA